MIEFFRTKNHGWPGGVVYAAASKGHWDLVKWLYGAGCSLVWYEVDFDVGLAVAEKGNLELLKWMKENNKHIHKDSAKHAAKAGHFEVVKWLCGNTYFEQEDLAAFALHCGNLEIFYWLINNGYSSKRNGCDAAVKLGLDVLKYARSLGFYWGDRSYRNAIESGDLDMVKWLHCNNCPKIDDYDGSSRVCYDAARLGQLEILKFLHSVCEVEPECNWFDTFEIGRSAITYGHIAVLEWLKEVTIGEIYGEFPYIAAYYGQPGILKWLLENGCSWDSNLCAIAATQGYVNILQWAEDNGYEWDRKKDNYTEIPGPYRRPIRLTQEPHAEALKLLENMECPWDLTLSDKNIYKEVVQFAQDSGCPWNGNIPIRSNEILDWMEKKRWCDFNSKTMLDIFDQDSEISETELESTNYETDSCSDVEFEFLEGLTFPDDEDDFNDEMIEEPYYISNDCPLYE